MHMRRHLTTLLLLATTACADGDARDTRPASARAAVGEPMPAYAAPTLDGDTVSLAALRGTPVLLNIWATWCPPCREEMPSLQRLHEAYAPQGLRILAVSIDNRGAADAVRAFAEEYGVTFTILHDPDENVSRILRTIGVPETYLVGRDGVLRKRWIGKVDADTEAFRSEVVAALAEQPRL